MTLRLFYEFSGTTYQYSMQLFYAAKNVMRVGKIDNVA